MSIKVVVTVGTGPSKVVEFPETPAAPEGFRFVAEPTKPKYVHLPDGRAVMVRVVSNPGKKP